MFQTTTQRTHLFPASPSSGPVRHISRLLLPLTLAALVATAARTARSATGAYTVTPIAPRTTFGSGVGLSSYGINNAGQISGAALVSGAIRAFRWDPSSPNGTTGTLVNLGGY